MGRTLRQFTCRDDLWDRVEALAHRRGMSADDVIQAALVQLFSRKADAPAAAPAAPARATPAPAPRAAVPAAAARAPAPVAAPAPRPAAAPGRLPPPSGRVPAAAVAPAPAPAPVPLARPLYLYFEGQVYEVNQDQFVIGRGSKYSDLPIKDANISRRHCAIVRRNGQYYIKDLESTNGVEFNGQRVDNHLIQEGTVYRLCDHELRFSFIPPS
jgi:hypothetical protein